INIPTTNSISPSKAKYRVIFEKIQPEHIEAMKENNILLEDVIVTKLYCPVQNSNTRIVREDFQIDPDLFVGCIVGNRLNEEITEEFLLFLENIVKENESLFLIFV